MTHALAVVVKNIKSVMEKKIKLILAIAFCIFTVQASAQVDVTIDERINEELRMKNAAVDTNRIKGYRVQIFFGSDMQSAEAAMSAFKAKFPEYANQVYRLYQQPSWKVRIGDFYREIEAQKLLNEVRKLYPDAFVVQDYIELPPLPTKDESDETEELDDRPEGVIRD